MAATQSDDDFGFDSASPVAHQTEHITDAEHLDSEFDDILGPSAPAPSAPAPAPRAPVNSELTPRADVADKFVDLSLSHGPAAAPSAPADESEDSMALAITVSDPVKQGDGMSAYITYRVSTRAAAQQFSVVRRYKDFEWLHDELVEKFPGVVVPPLPEKSVVGRFSPEFIESRRRLLERFLARLAAHPDLRFSADLKRFLESDEQAFEAHKEAGRLRKKRESKGVLQMFSDLGQSISKTIGGPAARERPKTAADLQFEEMEGYVAMLETQVAGVHRHTEKLVARLKDTANGLFEFGLAFTLLGQCEASSVGTTLNKVGGAADKLSVLFHEEVEKEGLYFEEPLKDYIRIIGAVKEGLARRAEARQTLANAEAAMEAKKAKHSKLVAVPAAAPQDKVRQSERELEEAEHRVGEARLALERISKTLLREYARFKEEKDRDLRQVVLDFVQMQVEHARRVQAQWQTLLVDIDSTAAAAAASDRSATPPAQ